MKKVIYGVKFLRESAGGTQTFEISKELENIIYKYINEITEELAKIYGIDKNTIINNFTSLKRNKNGNLYYNASWGLCQISPMMGVPWTGEILKVLSNYAEFEGYYLHNFYNKRDRKMYINK